MKYFQYFPFSDYYSSLAEKKYVYAPNQCTQKAKVLWTCLSASKYADSGANWTHFYAISPSWTPSIPPFHRQCTGLVQLEWISKCLFLRRHNKYWTKQYIKSFPQIEKTKVTYRKLCINQVLNQKKHVLASEKIVVKRQEEQVETWNVPSLVFILVNPIHYGSVFVFSAAAMERKGVNTEPFHNWVSKYNVLAHLFWIGLFFESPH